MMSKHFGIGISLGISLVIGLIALWTLEELPLRYALSITLSLAVFFLINLYAKYDNSPHLTLPRFVSSEKIWLFGWFLAILSLIIIKPLQVSSQFLAWGEIPWFMWVRLVASFMLTAIYPGYALITLTVQGVNLRFLEKAVLSIILSLFISAVAGFVGIVISQSIGISSFLILLSVNVVLFVLTSYLKRHESVTKTRASYVVSIGLHDIIKALLLVALLVFIALSVYSVNFPSKFVPTIDQWYHYGNVLRSIGGTLFSFIPYPYWTYMFEGLFIYATGAPPINTYMTLLFIYPLLPILCFYLMCSVFWSDKEGLVATTVYSLFSGFGGIYADYLRLTGNKDLTWIVWYVAYKTYDISAGSVSFSFYLLPKIIGLSAFFTLIYLMYNQELPKLPRCIFLSMTFVLGYLSHMVEMYLFLILSLFLFLFHKKDSKDMKDLSYGFILGLIIIAIVDLLAPQKVYGFYFLLSGYPNLPALAFILAVGLLYALPRLRLNFPSVGQSLIKVAGKLSLPFVAVAIYGLSLGIIIWIYVLPTFSIPYASGAFVWYLYPIRLGIASFMAVWGAYQLFRNGEFKTLKFSLLAILVFVTLERVVTYLTENMSWLAPFPAARIVEFTWIGIALLASAALADILRYLNNIYHMRKKFGALFRTVAIATLLAFLLVAGFSSTLYNLQIRSSPQMTLTKSELKALDFLRNKIPANVTVLALSYSINKIQCFAQQYPVMYYQPAIFGASTFETFVDIMKYNSYELYGHFPIKYFWLANSDVPELKRYENGYLVGHLLDYLPIVYKNEEVTIFEFPTFSPPSENSDLAVIMNPSTSSNQDVLEMLALANLNYTIKSDFGSSFSSNILILPNDIGSQELDILTCIGSKNDANKVIVIFNSLGTFGKYASLLSLNVSTEQKFTANGIAGNGGNITFPDMELPLFTSNDANVKPVAFYTKDGKPVSPYAFYKRVDNCEIFYVQIYPYFEAMQQRAGTDEGRETFRRLGDLVTVLGLNLPKYRFSSGLLGRAILYGQSTLTGNITFLPQSFYIPAFDPHLVQAIGWQQDVFENGWSTSSSQPELGEISVMGGDILTVSFNASEQNVWQYFWLKIPNINVSQYPYLILTEKIDASSYRLGFLRVIIGNYTYIVRDWTSETAPPGHPWKTYTFDLSRAIPQETGAPTPPRGQIKQIYWTAYSMKGQGEAKLYVNRIMLSSLQTVATNYGKITASLELSGANSFLMDNNTISGENFTDIRIISMQISGTFNSTFKGTEAEISPPGLGGYSRVIFNKGCSIILSLIGNSKVNLTTLAKGRLSTIIVSGGRINISLVPPEEELVVYMRDTYVSADGHAEFDKAFISWPYEVYDPELPLIVDGPFSFKLNIMDQDFSLVSGLKIEGEYKVSTQQLVQLSESNIPWFTVLTSSYHIILVSALLEVMRAIKSRHRL